MRTFIPNRKGQKIAVLVEIPEKRKGLAFVMHGLSGFKEQAHIEMFAKTFYENGYTAVRFDTTNTFGESDGKYEDATTTNYYEDLEDVINWAKTQEWYSEPFVLCGHSLGGLCVGLYAEKYPEKIKALAPISTVVSGKLIEEVWGRELVQKWEETGWREEEHASIPGVKRRLKYAFVEDGARYDLLEKTGKITMPVLLIVGDKDRTTPLAHQKILYDALPADKKVLRVISGGPHTFRDPIQLTEIKSIFDKWIKSLS